MFITFPLPSDRFQHIITCFYLKKSYVANVNILRFIKFISFSYHDIVSSEPYPLISMNCQQRHLVFPYLILQFVYSRSHIHHVHSIFIHLTNSWWFLRYISPCVCSSRVCYACFFSPCNIFSLTDLGGSGPLSPAWNSLKKKFCKKKAYNHFSISCFMVIFTKYWISSELLIVATLS